MKDAKGHGSSGRGRNFKPLPGHAYHKMTNDQLRYIAKDAGEAGRNAQDMGDERGINKYADQVNDAASVLGYRSRTGAGPDNAEAASALGQDHPKSAAAPVHDSMTSGRHGYNADAVNNAIASSNRAGRRIGGKEASAIHRLLKGR